jgi:ketopantoate reductase
VYKSPADAAASGAFDYVLCANKALLSATPSLEETIAPAVSANTSIVLLQNGVGNEEPLHKAFPGNTIISAVVWTGGKVDADTDGVPTVSQFARESLTMGVDYTPGLEKTEEDAKVARLSEILAAANSDSIIVEDIQSARWIKVIW